MSARNRDACRSTIARTDANFVEATHCTTANDRRMTSRVFSAMWLQNFGGERSERREAARKRRLPSLADAEDVELADVGGPN